MDILNTAEQISNYRKASGNNLITGFVPTMGALHEGHLSLIEASVKESDITIVSIFVNPTQFNDPEDFFRYPRHTEKDIEMLSNYKTDVLFLPGIKDIYPEKDERKFDFGHIETIMEGEYRPGHFNGVAQVVSRLFDIVLPDKAFFGQKDFQQLAVIKMLAKILNYNVEIISCPTVRESDGLAMSSRNQLLSPVGRMHAAQIPRTLFQAREYRSSMTVSEIKKWVIKTISENPSLTVEYFEIVDSVKLTPIVSWDEKGGKTGCIAVKIGKIRLIDNINFD